MNKNSQRIEWIDLAKAFMIMVVIFCHVPQYDTLEKAFFYTFQMPIFFFISGFLHKKIVSLKGRFINYWKTLFLPYIIFQIIYYPYYIAQTILQDGKEIDNLQNCFILPLLGTLIGLPLDGPTWFLFSLMLMKIIIDFVVGNKRILLSLSGILLMSFVVAYLFRMENDTIKVSFCIDGTFRFLPFFIIGQIFKQQFSTQMRKTNNKALTVLLSCVLAAMAVSAIKIHENNVWNIDFINYYIIASLGTASILLLCKSINKCPKFLSIISLGTIVILGTHWMFIGSINFILERILDIQAIKYSTLVASTIVLFITFINYFIIIFCMKHFTLILGGRNKYIR